MTGWFLAAAGMAAVAVLTALWLRAGRSRGLLEAQLGQSRRELERLQMAFQRFIPEKLVKSIIDEELSEVAQKREVTVMFADLKGFTRLSEELPPAVMVEVLNGYFTRMNEVIKGHHGYLSRFIGDGLMAIFGALSPNPWQVQDAVNAALDMREALDRYNRDLHGRGLPELAFGIGIHHGTVVSGLIGSDDLLEFTVIGDIVNVASRVEGLTRLLGADILVTQAVKARLDSRYGLREMAPTVVKGKSRPITTFAVERRLAATA